MSGCSRAGSSSRIARLMSPHSSLGGRPGLSRVETDVHRRWAYPGTLPRSSSTRSCIAAEPEPKASRRSPTKKVSASASRRPSMLHTARRKACRDEVTQQTMWDNPGLILSLTICTLPRDHVSNYNSFFTGPFTLQSPLHKSPSIRPGQHVW
jgi:hypothetical protein